MFTFTGETGVQPTDSAGLPGGRAQQLQPGDRGPGRVHLRLQHREAEQRGQSVHQSGGGRHSGPALFPGKHYSETGAQGDREGENEVGKERPSSRTP